MSPFAETIAGRAERVLIVCADDFGRSDGVNAGVIAAFERGIVTSASLMVRAEAAAPAAAYAAAHPRLAVGLHIDLGEWAYTEGEWKRSAFVVDDTDAAEVEAEVAGQLDRFATLVGRLPTHLDSHQHVHRFEPAASAVHRLAARLHVPVRGADDRVRHRGDFYGQTGHGEPLPDAITVEALAGIIRSIPAGVTELACHPGLGPDPGAYDSERRLEVEALCDPRVRSAIVEAGVTLRSFADLGRTYPARPPNGLGP